MSVLVSLANIVYRYNPGQRNENEVLSGVSLDIPSGTTVALLGPSGSGKSTLLAIAALLDRPHGGTITVEGKFIPRQDLKIRRMYRRKLFGVVTQFPILDPSLNVWENVYVTMRRLGLRSFTKAQACAQLASLGIGPDLWHRVPNELSGGEKQRVAIARALAKHPKLIFADEPTSALDSATANLIMHQLSKARPPDCSMLLVTHDETLARQYAQVIVRIKDGIIEPTVSGSPQISYV
ncbi:MAG: ABC transporter ATP-binding protein [Candidatus Saccharimonadia bacterium]